uniref:Uncharacterized protein n=1 Tax=Strix occidentalis caurina TaxID=311401 RepID=A0A8D0F8I5_STROC
MSHEQGTLRLCRCRPSCPPSFRTSLPQLPRFPGLCPSAPGQRATSSHQNSPRAWDSQTWLRALPSPVLTTPKCGDGRCTLIKISKASRQQINRKKRVFPCGFSSQASPNTWAGAQPSVMAGHQGNLTAGITQFCGFPPWWTVNALSA